jgi:hypothetical protein
MTVLSGLPERVVDKIAFDGYSGCWRWVGCIGRKGYGRVRYLGSLKMAHRLVYELLVGPVFQDLQLDHLCRTRSCVNPAHLEPVTGQVNVSRGRNVQREKTHCPSDHPYAGENLYVDPRGKRGCRTCRDEATRRYLARQAPQTYDVPGVDLP